MIEYIDKNIKKTAMRSQTLKKLSATTLVLQTLLSIALVFGMHGAVLAAGDPPATPPATPATPANSNTPATPSTPSTSSASESFSVKKYLTATGQQQSYLNTGNPIASFIIQTVNFLVLTIGSLSFVTIVVGGFILMTSHGNENALTKGKDILKYAIIGLAIALMAYIITAFVQSLFYEIS